MHLTAQRMVERVRKRVADIDSLIWTDQDVLDAAEDALNMVVEYVRLAGSDHELDRLNIASTAFTGVENLWNEYELPEWVGPIRRVEGVSGDRADEIPQMKLEQKELGRSSNVGPFGGGRPVWVRSRFGRPGSFSIFGDPATWGTVRVFFIRRYPQLHWGTAEAGGTATALLFDASPVGRVTKRDSLYVGLDVEITQTGANLDQYRRITAFTGSTAAATVATAFPATTASLTYSLVVPLEVEHVPLLIEETVRILYERAGNYAQMAAQAPRLQEIKDRVMASAQKRDFATPKRIFTRQL